VRFRTVRVLAGGREHPIEFLGGHFAARVGALADRAVAGQVVKQVRTHRGSGREPPHEAAGGGQVDRLAGPAAGEL
jgi:hypothetical protein